MQPNSELSGLKSHRNNKIWLFSIQWWALQRVKRKCFRKCAWSRTKVLEMASYEIKKTCRLVVKVTYSQNVFHFGSNLKKRRQITPLSTIQLKRIWWGKWFSTFFGHWIKKWRTFWDLATFTFSTIKCRLLPACLPIYLILR